MYQFLIDEPFTRLQGVSVRRSCGWPPAARFVSAVIAVTLQATKRAASVAFSK
jgi:hypothetical protein